MKARAITVNARRESHLEKVSGFVEFHLLKGPEAEDHTGISQRSASTRSTNAGAAQRSFKS
jgi:heme-degrading monooxygenase HmoA